MLLPPQKRWESEVGLEAILFTHCSCSTHRRTSPIRQPSQLPLVIWVPLEPILPLLWPISVEDRILGTNHHLAYLTCCMRLMYALNKPLSPDEVKDRCTCTLLWRTKDEERSRSSAWVYVGLRTIGIFVRLSPDGGACFRGGRGVSRR